MKKLVLGILCGLLLVVGAVRASEEAASSRENDFLPVGGWPVTDEVREEHERCMAVLKVKTPDGDAIRKAIWRLARLAIRREALASKTVSCLITDVLVASEGKWSQVAAPTIYVPAAINACAAIASVHRELVPSLLIVLVQLTKCVKTETAMKSLVKAFATIAVAVGRANEGALAQCINGIAAYAGPLTSIEYAGPMSLWNLRKRPFWGSGVEDSGNDIKSAAHRALVEIGRTVPDAVERCFDALTPAISGDKTFDAWTAVTACIEKGPVSDEMVAFVKSKVADEQRGHAVDVLGRIGALYPERAEECFECLKASLAVKVDEWALRALGGIAASSAAYAKQGLDLIESLMPGLVGLGNWLSNIRLAVARIGCAHAALRERCFTIIMAPEKPEQAFAALGEFGSRFEVYAERCITSIETCLSRPEWFVERSQALVPLGRIGGACSAYTERCLVLIATYAGDQDEYFGRNQAAVALRYLIDGQLLQKDAEGNTIVNSRLYNSIIRFLRPYMRKEMRWARDIWLYMHKFLTIHSECREHGIGEAAVVKNIASFCEW